MWKSNITRILRILFSISILIVIISTSVWFPSDASDIVRNFTRPFEFDFISWEVESIWGKLLNASSGVVNNLNRVQQRKIVNKYLKLLDDSNQLQYQISEAYSDPDSSSSSEKIMKLEIDLDNIANSLELKKKLAEMVIQHQIGQILDSQKITKVGTPFPPVLFDTTKLPMQLIISPRDVIKQEGSISLETEITLNEIIHLENEIEQGSEYSALVVPVGGIGTYPSMIIRTSDLSNLIEIVAHEWTHNYLTFRPLGIRYESSPHLRTMNETTASIAGTEISRAVIQAFYPSREKPPGLPQTYLASFQRNNPIKQSGFNFQKEMYETRVKVDELLLEGEIEAAEQFMEDRRIYFWENGYLIRKLNQAYFAFHGAYADEPFSAAGEDPVGDNVRLLRTRHTSLASFIEEISWMSSYAELRAAVRAF